MSSDVFDVKLSRKGLDLELDCTTTGAGGANDYSATRSFLMHALGWAADDTPLKNALDALGFKERWSDPTFYQEHADKFFVWSRLVRRENICDERARSAYLQEVNDDPEVGDVAAALRERFPPHHFVVQARLTEERFGEGLPESFGTVCCDVVEDHAMNVPVPDSGVVSAEGSLRQVIFPSGRVSDADVSSDGRTLFVRLRHVMISGRGSSAQEQITGAGTVLALDAATLQVKAHLALEPLLRRDKHQGEVIFTRVSPRGDSVFVVLRAGPAVRYGFGEAQSGEVLETFHPPGGTSFSDVVFDPAGRDSARVIEGHGVETAVEKTEWADVHATRAALDDARIAAVGGTTLAVYDRAARKERFRVEVGKVTEVALLPGGRTAVLAGPRAKEQVRIFEWDGTEAQAFNQKYPSHLRASPAGRLAFVHSMAVAVYDVAETRLVFFREPMCANPRWLGEDHLAALLSDTVFVFDVKASLAAGRVSKIQVTSPSTPTVVKAPKGKR